jgi:hypothetical protein
MKKSTTILFLVIVAFGFCQATPLKNYNSNLIMAIATKYDIKIKNDSGDEVNVYNEGSGGTYRLTKNATTTIKMEEGDKLYTYEKGKKGRLLLTATADLDGKLQLFSKL